VQVAHQIGDPVVQTLLDRDVYRPLLVNILSALILFSAAFFFKPPLYRLFRAPEKDYPIYCIAEPFKDANGFMAVDVFIINREAERFTRESLEHLLIDESNQGPDLELRWRRGFKGRIVEIDKNEEFNKGKGRIHPVRPTDGDTTWRIEIDELEGKALVKVVVRTDHDHHDMAVQRTHGWKIPFEIQYAGK